MKLRLDQDSINNNFFDNTRLLGIMAPLKNYFFCWSLNNYLGTGFKLNIQNEIRLIKKRREYLFNIYQWDEPETHLSHFIYHNQHDGEYLLPEFRNMDFLWLMKGDNVDNEKCNWLKKGIKNISGVQLVTELTHEQIKNKGNMIF